MPRSLTIIPLLAAAALLFACAAPSGPPSNDGLPDRTTHANESYFGVIDSIRSASNDGGAAGEKAEIHSIRIRYDDRSFQTVVQAGLDGLRVGDGVRIEQGRVRPY
jgi:hypothetical protein